ncbi:proteasome subunit beta type-2-like [Portunus trituberculatus]|uniref:proteasome subunit beta type-2-like n=1 Tax=Portunus trituberculatus TaxID=210409 RepID=UPI001E1D217B|nr:proteasome subunit beta type-2-like [Portunus trituberculatus]
MKFNTIFSCRVNVSVVYSPASHREFGHYSPSLSFHLSCTSSRAADMDLQCLIGMKFNDFVLMATDMSQLQRIMVQKSDDDKMYQLSSHLVMAVAGEAGDTTQFAEYIAKNIQLYKMRNGYELSPSAAVHFTRHTLATHLRSREPYTVNLLMGGYDPKTEAAELFYMDFLGASVPVNFYGFGYGGMFTLSITDREYRPDMTEDEAYELMKKCISEVKRRFIVNLPKFRVRLISKDGLKDLPVIVAEGEAA